MLYVSRTDGLTINQQGQRQTSVIQMTDGKDETWSPAEMSVARGWPWSVVADCSTLALQPQEMRGHRELIDGLTAPASSALPRFKYSRVFTAEI